MFRVLLVDDHAIFRKGLRLLLQARGDAEIIGEASDGRQAADLAAELRPDLVIMDISMPNLNGIDSAKLIRNSSPDSHILALTALNDHRTISEALRAGITGYVVKSSATEELSEGIDAVMEGRSYLSPQIGQAAVEDYLRSPVDSHPAARLSPREREVLQLLAEGKATKEIAAMLHLSVKTVETHRRSVMDKLNMYSIAELTKLAIREGLTSLAL